MGSSDPQFFKVFLPHLCSESLKIPDAFRDRITGTLPKKVILKNSIGKIWRVYVVENEDGLYFQEGWSKFVLDNSLTLGEFLVFKYNSHHVFDVRILSHNGCERSPAEKQEQQMDEQVVVNKRKFSTISGMKNSTVSKHDAEENQEGIDTVHRHFSKKVKQNKPDNSERDIAKPDEEHAFRQQKGSAPLLNQARGSYTFSSDYQEVDKLLVMGCNVTRFMKLVGKLTDNQRTWVEEMGFDSLLDIRIHNIDPSFGFWITRRFNPRTKELKIRDDLSVLIDSRLIKRVLGIPADPKCVPPPTANIFTLDNMRHFNLDETFSIREREVFRKTISEQHRYKFKKLFLLYTLGVLLCPTQKHWISSSHLKVIHNAQSATNFDWGAYVIEWLVKCREKYDSTVESYGGCTLLLLIIYLDTINPGKGMKWKTDVCRIATWKQNTMDMVLKQDLGPNGEYGAAQVVKPP